MTTRFLALACLTVLAVTACKPDTPEPAAGLPAAETAAPVATDLTPVREDLSSDHSSFDMKGFAGTFSGTLPCDSCPGIDTTVVLNPDGTWTVEADDRQIRLDPNSKSEADRLYAITSQQQITQLDADGQAAQGGLDYSLDRQAN